MHFLNFEHARHGVIALVAAMAVAALGPSSARAELSWSYSFSPSERLADPVEGPDGALYTSRRSGGRSGAGAIIRIDRSGAVTELHSFTGSDTPAPDAALVVGPDGHFYGTTANGGAFGYGTAFRMTPSGALTTLHSFTLAEGGRPRAALRLASDGNFYGTTEGVYRATYTELVSSSYGAIFRMTPAGAVTVLHTFTGSTGGARPQAQLIQAHDGHLYGTTSALSTSINGGLRWWNINWGTVFRITLDGQFTVLHQFNGEDGGNPLVSLYADSDGYLYGTTNSANAYRGPSTLGTIFRIAPSGGLTTIYDFGRATPQLVGTAPAGALVPAPEGGFYGLTLAGGPSGGGTMFHVTPEGQISVVRAYDRGDAQRPYTLVVGASGTLYGATWDSLYEVSSAALRVVGSVTPSTLGSGPVGTVVVNGDGHLYGVTQTGTVWRVAPDGTPDVLHRFPNGVTPTSLIEGADGALYGTTSTTIFRLTRAGEYQLLHDFAAYGGTNPSQLVQGRDGLLYGTARTGGDHNQGAAFRLSPTDPFMLEPLHYFGDRPGSGLEPVGPLVEGADGVFYGVTSRGGASNTGTIFRLMAAGSGELETIHEFALLNNATPGPGLAFGADGALYGTAGASHSSGGMIFRVTTAGELTKLHDLPMVAARQDTTRAPVLPLVRGTDGHLYGTTNGGGSEGTGTVYRLSPDGTMTTLHSFPSRLGDDRVTYVGPLTFANGALYGTTRTGGFHGAGSIFRLDLR